jgi:hypothetical protein
VNKATEVKLQWWREEEEANKFDELQGLSLSPSRRLILGRDTIPLPLHHLSNSQLTRFIFIFNTNFDLSRHPFSIPTLHERFMHEKKITLQNVLHAHFFFNKMKTSWESTVS